MSIAVGQSEVEDSDVQKCSFESFGIELLDA
jgi:hypothetical protein